MGRGPLRNAEHKLISVIQNSLEKYQLIRYSKTWPTFNPLKMKTHLKKGTTAYQVGAGNGIRTRDTKLGKLVLYQLSYARLFLKAII